MKKILITGGDGYVGSSLYATLKENYNVTKISRKDFDLLDVNKLGEWFKSKRFDVVIHCAIQGGIRSKADKIDVLDDNLNMYYNLLRHKSHYGKFINIGSGAELCGTGYYALSKKVIRESVLHYDNFYNIRAFGIFDENELDNRFIKANMLRYINKKPMLIHSDIKMDFFYMKDFVSLVEHYIENDNLDKEIDCCYSEKMYLSDIACEINKLDTWRVSIEIESSAVESKDYIGKFTSMPVPMVGFNEGLKNVYFESYKKF